MKKMPKWLRVTLGIVLGAVVIVLTVFYLLNAASISCRQFALTAISPTSLVRT